ncbi:MAG TPA: TetR family transcriptional regulator [Myxococcales bacterium LLY-WYZ-16_1]|nr:TetR family transcriptional regulator [Myxococcales bacterium LLY-WYZ-16_1]
MKMGRPSNRTERRRYLARAFERALSKHGLGAATVVAVAEEAGVAPGLIHHHFRDREDLVSELVRGLLARFRSQLPAETEPADWLRAYVDAALALRGRQGRVSARAWVGLFAEGVRSARVQGMLQRGLRGELDRVEDQLRRAGLERPDAERAAAGILSLIVGCLVFGAVMPGRAVGFAAPFTRATLEVVLAATATPASAS